MYKKKEIKNKSIYATERSKPNMEPSVTPVTSKSRVVCQKKQNHYFILHGWRENRKKVW